MLCTRFLLRTPINSAINSGTRAALPEPAVFQLRSIISLAPTEAACVLGFVQVMLYRTPLKDYVPFAMASIAIIALDIVPLGLKYWDAWEQRNPAAE